jgi:hypothetical protein
MASGPRARPGNPSPYITLRKHQKERDGRDFDSPAAAPLVNSEIDDFMENTVLSLPAGLSDRINGSCKSSVHINLSFNAHMGAGLLEGIPFYHPSPSHWNTPNHI